MEEAQHAGLLVDVTGDIVWHPEDSPAWYEAPGEHARWQVQARFWRAAARVGAGSPSVLCYELTSEPAIGDSDAWYTGLLLHYYVQYVDTSTNADALYRENLITFLGLRATLSASPAVPFAP